MRGRDIVPKHIDGSQRWLFRLVCELLSFFFSKLIYILPPIV
jgi:hypothetical protein